MRENLTLFLLHEGDVADGNKLPDATLVHAYNHIIPSGGIASKETLKKYSEKVKPRKGGGNKRDDMADFIDSDSDDAVDPDAAFSPGWPSKQKRNDVTYSKKQLTANQKKDAPDRACDNNGGEVEREENVGQKRPRDSRESGNVLKRAKSTHPAADGLKDASGD